MVAPTYPLHKGESGKLSNRNRNARRWLRADVRDVVRVVPRASRQAPRGGAVTELGHGLGRWSRRLARRRSLAVVRRQLLLGGTLAVIAALVILIAGGARPWWLAAAAIVFALVCGAVARVRRPSLATSAHIVDRALAMNDRLGTALELQAAGASGGLATVVRNEADAAIGPSLGEARVRSAPAGREWAWLAVIVCALAILIAVPRGGTSAPPPPPSNALIPGGKAGVPGAGGTAGKRAVWAGTGATTPNASVPLTPNKGGPGSDPYRYGGKQYKNNEKPAPVVGTNGLAQTPQINVAAPTPNSSAGAGSGAAGGGAHSGGAGSQNGSKLGLGQGNGGLQPAAGTGNGSASGNHSGNGAAKPGGSSKASGNAEGSQKGSGAAPSGGESAGSTRAAALGRASGITPVLGDGRSSLPLQAGFLPQAGKGRGGPGSSQSAQNGTGGASRTADVGGGGSNASGNFAALAPTFNSPSSNPSLQSYYFGTANQLDFKGW